MTYSKVVIIPGDEMHVYNPRKRGINVDFTYNSGDYGINTTYPEESLQQAFREIEDYGGHIINILATPMTQGNNPPKCYLVYTIIYEEI